MEGCLNANHSDREVGDSEDLAGAVTTASESSSFVTGQNLHVSGGLTLLRATP